MRVDAKFPSHNDRHDVGAWEYVLNDDDTPRLVVVASWASVSVSAGALLATKSGPPRYDAVTG